MSVGITTLCIVIGTMAGRYLYDLLKPNKRKHHIINIEHPNQSEAYALADRLIKLLPTDAEVSISIKTESGGVPIDVLRNSLSHN